MSITHNQRPEGAAVGRSIPHESAYAHVTGAAKYTEDLAGALSGVLHAYPVQSAHAHARLLRLDASAALQVPGVRLVLTAKDIPGVNDQGAKHDEPMLPVDEVMFHGQPVAWVLGEDLEAAKAGAAAVAVDYEPLDALVTLGEAIAANSFHGIQPVIDKGEPAAALAAAPHAFSGEFEFAGQEHFYLETQSSLAHVESDGQIMVHASTQHPSETQDIVAHVLGVDAHRVTVQALRMGGAFGGKEMQPHGYAAVAALGAVLTGRPVRVRLERARDLSMTGKRHGFHASWKIGFDEHGKIMALAAQLTSDGGWSLDLSEPVLTRAMCHIDNAYWIPNIQVRGRVAKCHKTSQTAFRGFGGPQGMLVIENILGEVAPKLGLSAQELRRRNFYVPGQDTPYYQPVRHAERLHRVWDQVLDSSQFATRREQIEAFNTAHPHSKRGLAITPVKFGISFNFTAFNQAGALVLVYKDGSVLLTHGGTEMGQGVHTKVLQVAATALGVPLSYLRLAPTRTDKVPNTSATAASTGSDLNGAAVKDACEQILARLSVLAAQELDVEASDIVFRDGAAHARGRSVDWKTLVSKAYFSRIQLSAAGYYSTPGLHWDLSAMRGEPFKYFAYGAAVSEVQVSRFDGSYQLRRVDIVHDVGDSLSPLVDRGQIEGGFIQGAGWLTLEDLRWETKGPHRGRLATASASTYKLPSFSEMPPVFNVEFLQDAHEDGVVYGSKAVGEPPLMLAFSVREALRQAVAAFGPAGHSV
ncbi:xanthine dehydrogenase molybdopterin binding subunit, partial [Glutamicibacter protophormiae]|uniref:xanthine dehydrogenase molybdopterin binding subunit n=1 Tax=Glutamicibacter protophormiae TaxID=37930 RepID=UPI003BAE52C6